ncbi:MAG: DUF2993 domain-containing protein [Halanaerobiales bacterium]
MKKIVLLFLLLILLLQLYLPGMAAENIKNLLFEEVDTGENVQVEVRSFPAWEILLQKRVDHLNITADSITFQKLKLENVNAKYENTHYNREKFNGENTDLTFHIKESTLNNYLSEKYPELEGMDINLAPDRVNMAGYINVFDNKFEIRVGGDLSFDKTNKLNFTPEEFRVEEISLPGYITKNILKDLKFVIDFDQLQIPLKAEEVKVGSDRIHISGGLSAGKVG